MHQQFRYRTGQRAGDYRHSDQNGHVVNKLARLQHQHGYANLSRVVRDSPGYADADRADPLHQIDQYDHHGQAQHAAGQAVGERHKAAEHEGRQEHFHDHQLDGDHDAQPIQGKQQYRVGQADLHAGNAADGDQRFDIAQHHHDRHKHGGHCQAVGLLVQWILLFISGRRSAKRRMNSAARHPRDHSAASA